MPNPKKPSERIFEMQQTDKDVFTYNVSYAIKTMAAILDEQHSQIQSLQKEVEELKHPMYHKGCPNKYDLHLEKDCPNLTP